MVYGSRVGGIWSAAPLLAWSGLFLVARLELPDVRRVQHARAGEGIWSWAICGVLFVAWAAPALGGLSVFGSAPLRRSLFGADAGGSRPGRSRSPLPAAIPGGRVTAPRGGDGRARTRPSDERARGARGDRGRHWRSDRGRRSTGKRAPDGIHESTQALLDRLERLADLRDRGLLGREEYETAKETIVRELETRQ